MILGIDIDGIVASFEHGYAPLLTQVSGIQFPNLGKPDWPTTWFWEREAGVTKEQESKVWNECIIPSTTFWESLPPHLGALDFIGALGDLNYDHDVYFVTNRIGQHVKYQTENWLMRHGWIEDETPTVIISGDKGAVCKALKITHYIDDKIENCQDVVIQSPKTQCFMLARPYNNVEVSGATRIPTLTSFLEVINGE